MRNAPAKVVGGSRWPATLSVRPRQASHTEGVVCLTAHESGWSMTPSKCYGSPVCAFGTPQASGFGSQELIAPCDPGTGSPVRWHCPFVDAYSPDYWTSSPTPERMFKGCDRRRAHFSSSRQPPAGTLVSIAASH